MQLISPLLSLELTHSNFHNSFSNLSQGVQNALPYHSLTNGVTSPFRSKTLFLRSFGHFRKQFLTLLSFRISHSSKHSSFSKSLLCLKQKPSKLLLLKFHRFTHFLKFSLLSLSLEISVNFLNCILASEHRI